MKNLAKFLVAAACSASLACGDDDDGGSASVDTGLPEDTELQEVSSEEYTRVCDSVRGTVESRFGVDRTTRVVCELTAAVFTDDPGSCRDIADECVTETQNGNNPAFSEEDVDFAADFDCGDASSFQDCPVTVGEFETCLNDSLTAIDRAFSELSCANAATLDQESLGMENPLSLMDSPASCARLETECPAASGGFSPQ